MKAFFAIPGDIDAHTGGYAYARAILRSIAPRGVALEHAPLPGGFPFPDAEELQATRKWLAALPRDAVLIVDGLAFGAFTRELLDALPEKAIALVHHPLALETGLSREHAEALRGSERSALARAAHVIASSATTADALIHDYGVAPERVTIAVPGVGRAPRATGGGAPPHILSVGTVTPRKGHEILVEALAGLAEVDWRATIAGSLARAPEHAARVAALVAGGGMSERIRLAGEADEAELHSLYAGADLFVLPSFYEGYGMVLSEAMARGLPIVTTTGGAAATTVPDAAALKVPPGDAPALREALRNLLGDAALRSTLAHASWAAGQALPAWEDTAGIIASVLMQMDRGGAS